MRENRLYQSDWLMRFYGFNVDELVNTEHPNLETEIDPKLSWALRNPHLFPIDINKADYYMILRVPGIGRQSAQKIIAARRFGKLYIHQLKNIGVAFNRAQYFITCADTRTSLGDLQMIDIRSSILKLGHSKYKDLHASQLKMF
ncbi:hypothetical protein [Niabella ginsengisoli]|uniref:Radical SAM protein n=1 Tax=Niabella ginsengisoli TaxID=522298 RepID=A0ABS9SFS9_9BACT|nr:hypothetical protein [Niabella ginsengisoli]MCH5597219.1 hypothetical protein [Niabella ginsengisoli]